MTYEIPSFALGQGRSFRISTSAIAGRKSPFACPASTAMQARLAAKSLQPNDAHHWRKTWDDAGKLHFAIRDGFDSLGSGRPIREIVASERTLTHAQRRFVEHSLELLQDLIDVTSESAGVVLVVVDDLRTSVDLGDLAGDITLFARHLASHDGSVHEVVRLRLRRLKPLLEPDLDWIAIAALVAMRSTGSSTARIRVADFSLDDGEYRVNLDESPEEVRRLFASHYALLPAALAGTEFNPGTTCSDCGFLNVCPAVPEHRGILGIAGRSVATRALSASDLVAYNRCPTAFLAQRRDHLPAASREEDDTVGLAARARGNAAHAVLRSLHERTPATGCAAEDFPDPATHPSEARALCESLELDEDAYADALPYLLHHPAQCSLGFAGIGEWACESRVVVFDPDADIVVVSTPDLSGETLGGEPIWRETKTTNLLPPDVETALQRYPDFALDVTLLAAGVPDEYPGAYAELEVLTPTGGQVYYVASTDTSLVGAAERIVADIATRFAADLTFDRHESAACMWCPTYKWCQPTLSPGLLRAPTPFTDDEFATEEAPF